MTKEIHAKHGAERAAHQRKPEQGFFRYAVPLLSGFQLIEAKGQKGDQVYEAYIDQKS